MTALCSAWLTGHPGRGERRNNGHHRARWAGPFERHPGFLHVRIEAPVEMRIERVKQQLKKNPMLPNPRETWRGLPLIS